MFLHLIADRNKSLFLSLTKALCHADGHFTDDERAMVEQYCKELEMATHAATRRIKRCSREEDHCL